MAEALPNNGFNGGVTALRGVAVLLVLAFHLGLPLQAGYLGVDIFFVISGYLIAQKLSRDGELEWAALPGFYRRRAARIVPSMLVVSVATLLAAPVFLLPQELALLGNSLIAAAVFVPNIFFWQSFDYFSTAAQDSPLLHFWSLGVEAQFYLVAPIVMMARRWFGQSLWCLALVSGVVASALLAVYAQHNHPTAGFYLLPARLWEFGVGMLCATVSWPRLRRLGWVGALVGGMGLVAFGGVPVLVVLGTACLLVSSFYQPGGVRWGGRVLQWIGQRSYTIYLWHWPLIVYGNLRWGGEASAAFMAMLLAVTFLLAELTSRLVENPVLQGEGRLGGAQAFTLVGFSLVTLALAGAIIGRDGAFKATYPPDVHRLATYADYRSRPEFTAQTRLHSCFIIDSTPKGLEAFDHQTCLAPDGSRPRLLLIGDSHAAHLGGALRGLDRFDVLQATMAGCRPFLQDDPKSDCASLMDRVLRHVPADVIVLSARWYAAELPELRQTLGALRAQSDAQIVVLGPIMEYPGGLPQLLAREVWTGRPTVADRTDPKFTDLDEKMRSMTAGFGASYVSLVDLLCGDGACETWVGDVPMQFDYGHLTAEGAAFVVREFAAELQ